MKKSNKLLILGYILFTLLIAGILLQKRFATHRVELKSINTPQWHVVNTDSFTAINLSRMDCEIIQADSFKVEIWLDEIFLPHIQPKLYNEELRFVVESGSYGFKQSPKVRIHCPNLDEIEVYNKQVYLTMNTAQLKVSLRNSAEMNLNGNFTLLEAEVRNSSVLNASGQAEIAKLKAQNSSKISTKEMNIEQADADASNASRIAVGKATQLEAEANNVSSISYWECMRVNKVTDISSKVSKQK